MTDPDLSDYERIRWNILGDLVFEDSYALWELALGDDREAQERALLDLHDRRWIFFYRLRGLSPNDAFEREELHLEPGDAREYISRAFTVQDVSVTGQIWGGPTEEGIRAATDPPVAVRRLWGWGDDPREVPLAVRRLSGWGDDPREVPPSAP